MYVALVSVLNDVRVCIVVSSLFLLNVIINKKNHSCSLDTQWTDGADALWLLGNHQPSNKRHKPEENEAEKQVADSQR